MLKKSGFALLLLLAAFAVHAQALPQPPTIRVSGDAKSTVEADMAVLSLGIVQQAKTPLAVREAVTAAADKVVTSLLALGVEKKWIRTGNFSIYPQYDERLGKQNIITGYKGEAILTVSLNDTALVAQAVEMAVASGANEIRSLDYRKKNEDALRVEMLKQAVANAMDKAEAMVAVLGRRLGKAITVEEQGYSMRAPDTRAFLAKSMSVGAQEAFSPGSIEVSASIVVVFEME